MSFWEKHKEKLYKFGHIYATLYGLVVINYIPQRTSHTIQHRLALVYSHLFSALLLVVLPIYFASNIDILLGHSQQRGQLQLIVNAGYNLIKYLTVVVTYLANCVNYSALRQITATRQHLEDAFARAAHPSNFKRVKRRHLQKPYHQFDIIVLSKFVLINSMMAVQLAHIIYQYCSDVPAVRVQLSIYTFVLWNYTENMADYFYFINASALKFYQQLHLELQELLCEAKHLHRCQRQRRAVLYELCGHLCDRLDDLCVRYRRIYTLCLDSMARQQYQMLGLILSTLTSNLNNFFTLFNLFARNSLEEASPDIALSMIHACIHYVDTYVVVLVTDHIAEQLRHINHTMRRFSEVSTLDVRLEQSIEHFALQLLNNQEGFRICGVINLDRRLAYMASATGFTYFITLIQFDMK